MTKFSKIATYMILIIGGISMIFPFLWMISTSLKTEQEVYQFPPSFFPKTPQWNNYKEAIQILPFGRFFLNSIIITLVAVIGQLVTCSMAAYAFARLNFWGRERIFAGYLATMMIPSIVTLIPSFIIINAFGWMDTYWALITPFLTSVWGIFLLRQFFMTIPNEFEEAARIDGATEWQIFYQIILPLAKPALATLALFAAMGTWKDFLWPLIVTQSTDMRPVEVGIAMFSSLYSTQWTLQMAAAVLVMLPILIVFIFAQRYFIKGLTLGGIKG